MKALMVFLWIGTDGGLNRYDGNEVKHYLNYSRDINSISNNLILSIIQDSKNNLWVGTKNGLNKINLETNQIARYFSPTISGNMIYSLKIDENKILWIGTDKGLTRD